MSDVRELLEDIEKTSRRAPGMPALWFYRQAITDVPRLVAALRAVLDLLRSQPHEICDDGWYSCSQAIDPHDGESACIDDRRRGKPCDCGRDALIAKVETAITEALGGMS